tara:strand:+ start:35608 stop:36021 length:414 start_codon:yes stop_codon:yes gene_type:complete
MNAMKKLFFTVVFALLFILVSGSCKNNDDDLNVNSTWQLIAYYNDPGDGSGNFVTTNEVVILEFYNDGIVSTTGSLCRFDPNADGSTGTYTDNTISPTEDCYFDGRELAYWYEGNDLILAYPCIEACLEKYARRVEF